MTRLLSSAMFAAGVALVVAWLPPLPAGRRTQRSMSDRRRRGLVDAVGTVSGSDEQLRRVAGLQVRLAAVTAATALLLVASRPGVMNVAASCAVVAAAWQLPLIRARSAESRRTRTLDLELSDTIGEMVMGVEAGLTFESVMDMYARRHDSPLSREFRFVLDRVGVGARRGDVMREFADRNPTLGVRMFVSAIEQNQRLGTPLADVLRQQGESSRRRRRQEVEEQAAKLSLKMIFPTVFCILPVLLIVIVGPAIVRLVHALPN